MTRIIGLIAALALGTGLGAAQAQSDLGQAEYMNSCASCHGDGGTGNGPLADLLTSRVSDLTLLQADNGGVFPVTAVYRIIDGSMAGGAHGTREMPIWGERYKDEGNTALGREFLEADRAAFVRGRILSLVEYLSTIQK